MNKMEKGEKMKEYAKELKFNVPEKSDIDKGLMEMLKFFLDTESKVKIYLYLLKAGSSTSDNIAEGTSIYPSTCKEALDSMCQVKVIEKVDGESDKYTAVPPSKLVERKMDQLEKQLNDFLKLEQVFKDTKEIKSSMLPFKIKIERVDNPDKKDKE
jgi:sugar-specific transcriptional regulator TrmB